MADIRFAVPEEKLSSKLFTRIGQWLSEEGLDFSFSVNKDLNEIPKEVNSSYFVVSSGTRCNVGQKDKLDRILQTIKLDLRVGDDVDEETETDNIVVKEVEIVSPKAPEEKGSPENSIASNVSDFVTDAMEELLTFSVTEQNYALEELYKRVQLSRFDMVEKLEANIEGVKESSHNLHETFAKLKPEWLKRKSR